ncbi:MAG: inositol-phosphate phosphatase [Gammaproteobacteria bacterium]|nr:inositol-phosphate phosphatase [Gammaproteobacteria bacterium]
MASLFLSTAIAAARAAQQVINHYYQSNLQVTIKSDQSPVTIADVESEKVIKSIIHAAFPDHGFYGEETGQENMQADYLWLIDPIDGTKSFVRRYPMFSTQIALMHKGELILGVSNAPAFGEMAWAEKGTGAYLNGAPIRVSDVRAIKNATLSTGNIATLARSPSWGRLGQLINQVHRIRGYGDFLHYHLLAAGKIDLVVESDVNILDIAALSVIIKEAGGVFTDLEGQALNLATRSVLSSNSVALHREVLARLNFKPV